MAPKSPHGTSPDGHPHGDADGDGHPGRDYSRAPLVVTWEVTQACDLACDHCRAEADPDRSTGELSVPEARDFFEQVAEFSPQPFLVLSGGDPLKRPDVFELLETAVDVGVTPSITPATTALLDRETIERFAEIGVGRMALSLDGATPESHDGFRGEDGTFETATRAAEHARDVGLSIQINTTVTASTADELPAIARIVDDFDAAMWEVFFLVPTGRGTELEQLTPGRAREVMAWLYRHSRESPYRVITVEAPFYRRVAADVAREEGQDSPKVGSTGAGNGFVFVSHTGEVYPSGFLPVSAGNVRDDPLPEIYRDADLMDRLRERESFAGPCGSCPFTAACGGSRSRAYAATGDPLASDPLCPYAGD
jgi:radical SAM protein with 4Fe4S-binding SPASM domain